MATVTLSEAKAQLPRLLAEVVELGEQVLITRSGRPAGVLVSVEEYEGLLESMEILADPEMAEAVRRGLTEAEKGLTVAHEDLWRESDD